MCSLGLWVCEELMQTNIHQQVTDAINVLGVTLKVSEPPPPPSEKDSLQFGNCQLLRPLIFQPLTSLILPLIHFVRFCWVLSEMIT